MQRVASHYEDHRFPPAVVQRWRRVQWAQFAPHFVARNASSCAPFQSSRRGGGRQPARSRTLRRGWPRRSGVTLASRLRGLTPSQLIGPTYKMALRRCKRGCHGPHLGAHGWGRRCARTESKTRLFVSVSRRWDLGDDTTRTTPPLAHFLPAGLGNSLVRTISSPAKRRPAVCARSTAQLARPSWIGPTQQRLPGATAQSGRRLAEQREQLGLISGDSGSRPYRGRQAQARARCGCLHFFGACSTAVGSSLLSVAR